ncbi:MAG: shikimate dehydrogenase [Spirochaetota bacterium]|nr:shikimate dehydrogenase [Spirochaetota bacterium]
MLRCLSLTAEKDTEKIADIQRYAEYIDAVEVRLDLCEAKTPEMVGSVVAASRHAGCGTVVVSYRRPQDTADGSPGDWDRRREDLRRGVLRRVLQPGVTCVDLEYDVTDDELREKAESLGIRMIRSVHDFTGIPGRLPEIVRSIAAAGDIPKVACSPQSSRQVLDLVRMCVEVRDVEEKIILGMGAFGFFTRTAPWICGSMLTFVSAGEKKAAPGHIGPRELEEVYGTSRHGKDTVLFGIIGNPVMHTRSPHLHNRWFADDGIDAVYLPFHVDEVGSFMELAETIGVRGFSVTVPHKQRIMDYLTSADEGVRRIGACNTAVRRRDGWHGTNTDLEGFLEPLRDLLAEGRIRRALVIGAGGAARTVVYALRQQGIGVTIVNRTVEKARELADEMGAGWARPEAAGNAVGTPFDLVVQTTSVGMEPDIEGDPLPLLKFSGSEIVYDIIYAPEKTRFLTRAEESGCRVIGGRRMLHAQAELQYTMFRDSCNLWA